MSKKIIKGNSRYKSQPLSAFDLVSSHERFPYSFVYEKVLDEEKLIESLQEALYINPYFSGRMVFSKWDGQVILNNGGAEFEVERIEKDIPKYGLHNPLKNDKQYFTSFVSTVGFSDQTPLLKVKLFQFNDGSILSVTASHILSDGTGLLSFIKDWAALANGRSAVFREHDKFTFRHNYEGAEKSLKYHLSKLGRQSMEGSGPAEELPITKIFRIKQASLKKIMEEQKGFLKDGAWVSTRDVLAALVWKNSVDFDQFDKDDVIGLVTTFDMRKLLSLQPDYVGNISGNRLSEVLVREAMDFPVIRLARVLRESAESLTKEDYYNDLIFCDTLLKEDRKGELHTRNPNPKNFFVMNNISKFGWDQVDFGGKPLWFDIPAYPNVRRWAFILSAPDGIDFDCHICLAEREMAVLEKNLNDQFPGEILVSPVCRP